MLDPPSGARLVEAVIRYLRNELMPGLDGTHSFRTRVAANALELALREMEGGEAAREAERDRLGRLFGAADSGEDLPGLNRRLCDAIRAGEMDLSTPGLREHLWSTVLEKLAIEQPGYAAYRREIEEEEARMITVVFCVRKRPDMGLEEFRRYWWEEHGPYVKARAGILRMKRYVQMPALLEPGLESVATARGAPEAYDGIAQVSWESMDALKATFTDPAARRAGRELLEDERRFIDFSRSPIFFTEERVVVGD